ncbi:GNAT family N-acetyltransferase [Kitasatospora sp. NPDC057223]|uniref:GNAT family N-acetyltransferase n=1 Tax=Kitasatospora sp. NPDC057223 TaxID=3346055 RepID=UPI003630128B
MQGQPAHPAERPGRTRRPGRDPVGVRGHPQPGGRRVTASPRTGARVILPRAPADLLDGIARWGTMPTDAGDFRLRPVRLTTDLPLLAEWMNDPEIAAFWELDGPPATTEQHLRGQIEGDGRSVPCLGLLDGSPVSYWEVYRADLDPLARYYPARPHDTGVHLLLGPSRARGRGLGSLLIAALAERILQARPRCNRVVAEPDVRNLPSVRVFERAGFEFTAELDLPTKRAALMIRRRPAAGRPVQPPPTMP